MIIMQSIEQLENVYKLYELQPAGSMIFLHDYETNNWLKLHNVPMRRKPFKRKIAIIDEIYKCKR